MTTMSPRHDTHRRPKVRAAAGSFARISFYGHAIVWFLSCLLISVAATPIVGVIVALAWGIGLAAHGFFGVAAPALYRRWREPEPARVPPMAATRSSDPLRAVAAASVTLDAQRARSLEELSAAIAHEIRNPITAAKSLVQQIAEDPGAIETRDHAQVAVDELDRVERSIAHLLRFAREVPFAPGSTDARLLVESAIELVRDRAQRENVQLRREIDALPEFYADAEQLRTVIANLISNALDAHAEHGTRDAYVSISAGQNLAGNELWFRVRDNGPGIAREAAARIFRPFYTTKARGTGLGLALARKVVERHGGSLELASGPGQGAEFLFVLPRELDGAAG
jgi:signal transduction histidine kinase